MTAIRTLAVWLHMYRSYITDRSKSSLFLCSIACAGLLSLDLQLLGEFVSGEAFADLEECVSLRVVDVDHTSFKDA